MVKALEGLKGVKRAKASHPEKKAIVFYDASLVTFEKMQKVLFKAGYVASIAENDKQASNIYNLPTPQKAIFQKDDLVCFCFGYTRSDIEQDYLKNAKSLIMERIALEKKAGGCDCAVKNPRGR